MTGKAFLAVALVLGLGTGLAQAAGKPEGEGAEQGRFGRLKALDADRDGAVTADEFAKEQQERFAKKDTNKDGKLTAEEVVVVRAGKSTPEDRADRMIKRYDSNADERVSKDEFDAGQKAWFAKRDKNGDGKLTGGEAPRFAARRGQKPEAPTLEKVLERGTLKFKSLDTNGDGAADLKEMVAADAERRAYRIKKAMHRLDVNRDGWVTPEEFLTQARQRFGSLDLDSDGRITAEDLPPQARLEWKAQ